MMKQTNKSQWTGEQLLQYYEGLHSDYASLVRMLPYAAVSLERAFQILERCQKEGKRLFAHYPGIDPPEVLDQVDGMEPIGPIIDGYMYLVPGSMQNYNLRGKSIFDFTMDPEILKEIVGFDPNDDSRKTHYLESCSPINLAGDISLFAKKTHNTELQKAGESLANRLRRDWNRRCTQAQKKGLIID
ncbi:hypothetical protein JZU61_04190 [bacterium]|nr:hypothetical protein [bacterium]MBV5348840.1 hypothetical protein [bacterium]